MRIAILGAGRMGETLGRKWASAGHEVAFGVRDPEAKRTAAGWDRDQGQTQFGSVGSVIERGEVIVLAVPGAAVAGIIRQHGQAIDGKIVIYATNNVRAAKMHATDAIVAGAPGAKLFRAFNSLGWKNFARPVFDETRADMFYCGDGSRQARGVVEELIEDVGLRPVGIGGLDKIDILDGLTRLWFILARRRGRHLAFKMLAGDE